MTGKIKNRAAKKKTWSHRLYWFENGKWHYRSYDITNKEFERKTDYFTSANGYHVTDVKYDGSMKIVFCMPNRMPGVVYTLP